MAMRWHDLVFLHWPVPAATLRPLIPRSLTVDTFDGHAWIGIVPFRMTGVRPRCVPSLPWLSAFAELNVRTYVTVEDKPGVWFFSLDAANPVAVRAARRTFHLPYYDARISLTYHDGWIRYRSRRTHRGAPDADLIATYRPVATVATEWATREYWLTSRYCLYTVDRSHRVWRGEIDHDPWPLQAAEVKIEVNSMTESLGIGPLKGDPLAHFARRLDVVAWSLDEVSEGGPARQRF